MKLRGIDRSTACVVTQTVVDPADPAFQNPTKPVGAFLSEEEAKAKAAETGWTFKEDAGRGWRQVVASPKPVRIVEFDAVKDLEAEEFIAQGQFAPGSMLPKVEACIEYVRAYPEGKALITSLECAAAGLEGKTGTVITA